MTADEGMPHFQQADEVHPPSVLKSSPVARNKKSEIDGISKMLKDAEYLLDYAAEAGIELDKDLVRTIIAADTADVLSDEETVNVMEAISSLAKKLYPVTAETVRQSKDNAKAHQAARFYSRWALFLLPVLILFSAISFVATGLSNSITQDINQANQLAVTLTTDLGQKIADLKEDSFAPTQAWMALSQGKTWELTSSNTGVNGLAVPLVLAPVRRCALLNRGTNDLPAMKDLTNLQQFTAASREAYGLSEHLRPFVLFLSSRIRFDDDELELKTPVNLACEILDKVPKFQQIRYYAKDTQQTAAWIYGALNNSFLPVIYAVLGAFAFLLKNLSEQVKNRTFVRSHSAESARFAMAAIGGQVLGLFSGFTLGSGSSLSLLGLAFLVGYGTEIFFSFLDGLEQAFKRVKINEVPAGPKGQ